MIDNHIQMIHCHSSAGKVWKQPKVILLAVIIKQSLLKRCRVPVGFLMDFNWNSRSGYEYFTNCLCEQQRGTKEVETVSLKNVIFGQKQNKSPVLLLPLLQYTSLSSHWILVSEKPRHLIKCKFIWNSFHHNYSDNTQTVAMKTIAIIQIFPQVNASTNVVSKWPSLQNISCGLTAFRLCKKKLCGEYR